MSTGEYGSSEDWKFAMQSILVMFMLLPPTAVAGWIYVKKP